VQTAATLAVQLDGDGSNITQFAETLRRLICTPRDALHTPDK